MLDYVYATHRHATTEIADLAEALSCVSAVIAHNRIVQRLIQDISTDISNRDSRYADLPNSGSVYLRRLVLFRANVAMLMGYLFEFFVVLFIFLHLHTLASS